MSRQTIAVSVKASKLTARALAYVVAAVGWKIAKEHRKAQTPHGKQSVRKLMGHGGDTNAIEVDTPTLHSEYTCFGIYRRSRLHLFGAGISGIEASAACPLFR